MGYTNGPWFIWKSRDINYKDLYILDFGHWALMSKADEVGSEDDDERLICAAPCLLEALIDIADDYSERFDMDSPSTNPGMKQVVEAARKAIARAKGEAK